MRGNNAIYGELFFQSNKSVYFLINAFFQKKKILSFIEKSQDEN